MAVPVKKEEEKQVEQDKVPVSKKLSSPIVIVTPDLEDVEGDPPTAEGTDRESLKRNSSQNVGIDRRKSSNTLQSVTGRPRDSHGNLVSELSTASSTETDINRGKTAVKKSKNRKSYANRKRRRSSVSQSEKETKLIKSEKNTNGTGRKASISAEKSKVFQNEVKIISEVKANKTPTPTSFESVTTLPQRRKNRMEELIQSYASPDQRSPDFSSSSPFSPNLLQMSPPNALTQRFGNVFRASRCWERSEDDTWERRRVHGSDSDQSQHSSTTMSDSEKDEFSLAKVPMKKTKSSLYAPTIINVLYNLEVMKKKRRKKSIRDQVKSIKERVYQALKNVDMHDSSDEDESNFKLPSIFPGAFKRGEEKRRNKVMEGVLRYVGECNHRYQIISEVNDWISDPCSLADGMIPDEEMDGTLMECEDIHENVLEVLNQFGDTTSEVVRLGGQLLKEASNIIKENELQAKKMQGKPSDFNIVYDERALLSDPVKWDNAVKMVLQTLNDAVKWTKNASHKHLYGKCTKQFRNLSVAMSKKEMELKEKRKTVEELKTKMNIAKAAAEKQVKEMDEVKKVVRRMSVDVEEKKNLLAQYEEKNKTLMRKLQGYESQMKILQAEIETRIVEKTVTVTQEVEVAAAKKPKKPPPSPEVIKVVDSSTQLKLDETEVKLKEALDRIELLRDKLRELDRQLKHEQEKVRILRSDLEKAERAAEEAMEAMPDTINMIEVPIEAPQQDVEKDSAYYKTLLSGMKNEFNTEIEKLKGFLKKERSRNIAAVRRVENNHKDHLHAIQKDTLRVLRAIIHFRDHVITILEKENLKEPAFALTQLPTLIPEKLVPDPREMLALLVGNVVEYMHKMELTLANAFLAMRMVVKSAIEAQKEFQQQQRLTQARSVERIKDEESKAKVKHVTAAKMETTRLTYRLKKAKERLQKFEEISDLSSSDKKYLALLERYRMVWKMYNRLQKDMDVLQADFQTSLEEQIKEREDIMVTSIRMDLKASKKSNEAQLKLTIGDQKKNLDILQRAFEDNKISKDLYAMAVSLIKKAMVIPQKRLRYLVEQYIAFQTVKETRTRVKVILSDEHLGMEMRKDIISYMKRIDEKFHMSMTMWHEQMAALEKERRNLFKSIWKVFTNVVSETGLLLVHPLLKEDNEDSVYARLTGALNRDQLRRMLSKRKTAQGFSQLPKSVNGYNALNSYKTHKMWQTTMDLFNKESDIVVTTPHTVEYDINKPLISAAKQLREKRGTFPLAQTQNYFITKEMQIQD
ncbi:paramyosin-like [Ylistrum balloti]|uniref:paramyosin-like n=1 Tax=Ylistrum balloti TaxID=509963 RepID=UPI0029058E5A|nr:paramyosin-like [Ylistrum balloti]